MKNVRFSWAWDGQADRADPLMNRDRAATLLREWRKDPRITLRVARSGCIHAYSARTGGAGALMVINGEVTA